jgi:hypothetical protein
MAVINEPLINLSQAAALLEINTTDVLLLARRQEFNVIERGPTKTPFFNRESLTAWKRGHGAKYITWGKR